MNDTLRKFGYPATLVREFKHWVALLRPAQPTLGSLVLAAKSDATAFGELPGKAHAELKQATAAIEAALGQFVAYERINYLMLMMVDREVHFHVIPRYAGVREFGGVDFVDAGWPKTPALDKAIDLNPGQTDLLVKTLRGYLA